MDMNPGPAATQCRGQCSQAQSFTLPQSESNNTSSSLNSILSGAGNVANIAISYVYDFTHLTDIF